MWFITVMEKIEPDEVGWPEFGCCRTPGFFECYEDARYAVINNVCEQGLYLPGYPREWYKYDEASKKYLPIEEPKYCANITNMAIG